MKELGKDIKQNVRDAMGQLRDNLDAKYNPTTYVKTFTNDMKHVQVNTNGEVTFGIEAQVAFLESAIDEACTDLALLQTQGSLSDSNNPVYKEISKEENWEDVRKILADVDPTGVMGVVNKFLPENCVDKLLDEPFTCSFGSQIESKNIDVSIISTVL